MAPAIEELRKRLAEIDDLGRAAALLAWDERTMMPPAAGPTRSQQQGSMAAVRHRMFVDDEIGELIEAARAEVGEAAGAEVGETPGGTAEETDDQALVRIVARDWRKARLVPEELRAEITVASSVAEQAWVEARANSDFGALLPHLERNVELRGRYAGCYEGFEDFSSTYDALLDEFEPGMRPAEMQRLLADLRDGPGAAGRRGRRAAASPSTTPACAVPSSRAAARPGPELVAELPLPEGAWRLDPTVHPFAISISAARRAADHALRRRLARQRHLRHPARGRPRHVRGRRRRGARADAARASPARSACTSRRAGCGRTGSAAGAPTSGACCPACASTFPAPSTRSTSRSSTARSTGSSAR